MNRSAIFVALNLLIMPCACVLSQPNDLIPATPADSEIVKCDTAVEWMRDYDAAFDRAKKTGKPIYVFHLSGNLLNKDFT